MYFKFLAMKKLYFLILLFIVCCSNSSFAQYQSVFGSTQTSWNVYSQDFSGDIMDSLVVCCDTVINGKSYKTVDNYKFCVGCNPNPILFSKVLFLREDTSVGKVWQITPSDTINEKLIMNLSLTLTDSFEVLTNQFFNVDSIYIKNGKKYIRLVGPLYTSSYDEKYTMIEGVGTNIGVGVDFFYGGPGNSLYLLCSYKDNNLEYQNTHPMYNGYCFLLTGINENENNIKINVYPNPSRDELTIEYTNDFSNNFIIKIYNTNGKFELIKELNHLNKATINTHSLPVGIYLITLQDNEKTITIQKWIKTE